MLAVNTDHNDTTEDLEIVEVVVRLTLREGYNARRVARELDFEFHHEAIIDATIVDVVTEN